MTALETCPKCDAEFPTRKALVARGVRVGYNAFDGKGIAVRCPNCLHVFPARHLRLFGRIPSQATPWIIAAILAACILISFAQRHAG